MKYANYKSPKFKYKLKNFDYVIYAHSFVDGQLFYGYDGFSNLFEWLDFTIEYLLKKKKKILVKGHPNFYNKSLGDISYQDSKLFEKIMKKYSNSNIVFINEALKNSLLLKNIDKRAIIISHHGTALLESTFLGFKTICSKYCIWDDKFHISNQWANRNDYKKLLDKEYDSLRFFKSQDLFFDLIHQLYFNEYGYYKKKNFHTIIENHTKNLNKKILKKNYDNVLKFINLKKLDKIIKKLSKNIEEINI